MWIGLNWLLHKTSLSHSLEEVMQALPWVAWGKDLCKDPTSDQWHNWTVENYLHNLWAEGYIKWDKVSSEIGAQCYQKTSTLKCCWTCKLLGICRLLGIRGATKFNISLHYKKCYIYICALSFGISFQDSWWIIPCRPPPLQVCLISTIEASPRTSNLFSIGHEAIVYILHKVLP